MIRRSPLLISILAGGVALAGVAPSLATPNGARKPDLSAQRRDARARMIEKLKTKQAKPFDKPQEAMDFYWSKRSPDGRAVSVARIEKAQADAARLPLHTTGRTGTRAPLAGGSLSERSSSGTLDSAWEPLGPGNIGGRSRALLFHRGAPDIMWTAGVAGGVWRSADAGGSWHPKADLLVNIAVSTLEQDRLDQKVLYAGTGEGFFNADGVRGQGIFKSADLGETWQQLPSTDNVDFQYVQKIVAVGSGGTQRLYAATRTGLFRSLDSGVSWTREIDAAAVRGCMDIAAQHGLPDGSRYVFVSCGTIAQGTVYRALDTAAAQTFDPVLSTLHMGRTSLAVARSNPGTVYALASYYNISAADPLNYGLRAVYRSQDSGANWTPRVEHTAANKLDRVQLTNPVYAFLADCGFGPANQNFNQGWYDNQIAVDPKDEDIVWTAGIDLMRSDDGGQTWGVASYWWFDAGIDPTYSHADQHAIVFHPRYNGVRNRQMFVASDGGIFRTDDARAAVGTTQAAVCGTPVPGQMEWVSLNNAYQVTQFYHGTVYPDGQTFFGGTQDNGTIRGNIASGEIWHTISGGDGGYVAVNTTDTDILYGEFTGKSLQRSLDGGLNWTPIHGGVTEAAGNFQFIHPFAMDPTNSSRLWYGGAFPWRSDNGGTNWTQAGAFFASRIASWAVAPSNPDRVYAGVQHLGTTTSGVIFSTNIAGTSTSATVWAQAQPRQGYVSSLAVDPADPLVAYATYSTYDFAGHEGHVFKTINGGANWTRIDATLPDMPVHSVVIHPTLANTLYLGTDLGVFVTLDGGATWLRENTGFANTVVEHLQLNNGRLFAFTHGRSAWSVPLTVTP